MIQSTVAGERQEPGDKWAALSVIGCGIAPELQENVLDDFFRRGCLLEDSQDQGVNGARMAIVELLERVHVPAKKVLHQRSVRRHFTRIWSKPQTCQECQEHRRFFVSYL